MAVAATLTLDRCCEQPSGQACAGTCFGTCVALDGPGCSTCSELGWATGGDQVCAESDGQTEVGWSSCQNEIAHADADEMCMSVGARLCTAAELFENAEGQGTGCGHDNRLIWSSDSSLSSGGVNLRCARPACSMDLSRSDAQRLVQTF